MGQYAIGERVLSEQQQTSAKTAAMVNASRRATRAEIDLDAVASNVRFFVDHAGPRAGVMAVVKANAYGHGAIMVARAAIAAGARWLAVATVDEGCQLRAAGLTAPILVLAPSHPDEATAAVRADLTLAVADLAMAAAIGASAGVKAGPNPCRGRYGAESLRDRPHCRGGGDRQNRRIARRAARWCLHPLRHRR